MVACGLVEKHTLEDGTSIILDSRYRTGGKYYTKDGRPVIDILGRFKGGKNVNKFLKAKIEIVNQDLKQKSPDPDTIVRVVRGIEG